MPSNWEFLAFGVDAALSLMFFTLWRKGVKAVEDIESVRQLFVGDEVEQVLKEAPDQELPYVCVEGSTEAVGPPLRSMYRPECERGVIQKISLIEHRSRRNQGYWTDSKRVIRDATNVTPFQLISLPCKDKGNNPKPIQVDEPLAAEYLMDDLRITYDTFEPNKGNMVEKGVERLFGDVSRGFQETEKMLGVGVHLLGFGRVVMEKEGNIRIKPPTGGQLYILTTLTREEAVKVLYGRSRFFKVMFLLFGAVGAGLLCYWGYQKFKLWKQDFDMRRAMDEFRRSRAEGSGSETEASEGDCVICLSEKREVVLLNCGHICLCNNCALALPEPQTCPVCRMVVSKIQPVYMP